MRCMLGMPAELGLSCAGLQDKPVNRQLSLEFLRSGGHPGATSDAPEDEDADMRSMAQYFLLDRNAAEHCCA